MYYSVTQENFILQNIDISSLKDVHPTNLIFLLIKAEWCPHCTNYLPTYDQYSVKYPDISFVILEVTKNENLVKQWSQLVNPAYEVSGFPTVVLYNPDGSPNKIVENRFNLEQDINGYKN